MANPYDFSSGFLAAKQLQNQEQQTKDLAAYRKEAIDVERSGNASRAGYYDAEAALKRAQARVANRGLERSDKIFDGLVNPIVDKLITGRTGGISAKSANEPSINIPSISSGYQFGFKPVDYSIQQQTQLQPEGFADGTTGGLGIKSQFTPQATGLPSPAETSLQPKNLAIEPTQTEQTNQETGLDLLGKRDPKLADTVARNVFGMSGKDFQKLSGALALVDFANGKSTATDLTNHMEGLRKIQSEGVLRSANAAIAGNEKEAIALYHDNGADNDSVASMKKIRIENPIAGAHKNMKDSYDGVLVTLKDGSKLTLDPRRLAADVIGVAKSMEHDEKVDNSIRVQTSQKYSSDMVNSQTKEMGLARLSNDLARDKASAQQRLSLGFDRAINDDMEILKSTRGVDIINNPEAQRAAKIELDKKYAPAQSLASINIDMGNTGIDSARALKYSRFMMPVQEGSADFDWLNNANNWAIGKDGRQLGKVVNGVPYYLTRDNVFIPKPPIIRSQPAEPAAQESRPNIGSPSP
jgi:hypothetical protein